MSFGSWLIVAVALVLLVYEVWALFNKHSGDTISEIMLAAGTKRPLIPFALGMLMGHFWWQMQCPPCP